MTGTAVRTQSLPGQLEQRVGRAHLRQRLGIEADREAKVFGQGRNFFHIENWYSVHGLIRHCLRLTGLHGHGRRNARRIHAIEHTISLPHLPRSFAGFTVLHLTDLHVDMQPDMAEIIARAVEPLHYDLCVWTGDYRGKTFGAWQAAVDGLAVVRAAIGSDVLAVLGNHDSIEMVPALEAAGIQVLLNERLSVARKGARIHFAGIDDPHYFRADNLEKACDGLPDDEVSVLLSHSPEIYRHAAYAGFDVLLCGHTHGGQICLPGGFPLMCNIHAPRRMCAGSWRYGDMVGYTSRGAGVSVVDVRLNCPAEVTLHRFERADANNVMPRSVGSSPHVEAVEQAREEQAAARKQ